MTPRQLQIVARLQQAQQVQAEVSNLLLQELAEALEQQQAKPEKPAKKGKTDG